MTPGWEDQPQPFQVAWLLTASATTGWLDWIHGELWLLPSGLLRRPLGLWKTVLHGTGPTVNQKHWKNWQIVLPMLTTTIADSKNVWVPREHIVKAYLHEGMSADRLKLVLTDSRTVKFLWLPWDNAFHPLQTTLSQWLGEHLIID